MKALIVVVAIGLGGCAPEPPRYVPPATPCEGATRLINSPSATPAQQLVAIEYAKRHCIGPQPVQRIRVVP